METLLSLLLNAAGGVIAANVTGLVCRGISLGILGNTLAGIVGGILGGELLDAAATSGFMGQIGEFAAGAGVGTVLALALGAARRRAQIEKAADPDA